MACLYQELLSENMPVIFDGALGTQIQKVGFTAADFGSSPGCNEILNCTRPEGIAEIHAEYIEAGAAVIETNTFGANAAKLKQYGLGTRVADINRAGAALARGVADRFLASGRRVCVCGTMGPSGYLPSSKEKALSGISFDALAALFEEQAEALLGGGVDLLLLETQQDLLEVRAALYGIRRVFSKVNKRVPVQVQATMDAAGRTLLGGDCLAFLGAAVSMGADVVGLNCGTGPAEMAPHIARLLRETRLPVSAMPNAGAPVNKNGAAVYRMEPAAFADVLVPLVIEQGLPVVGGCCGTTPAHIRELSRRLAGRKAAPRSAAPEKACFCGTGLSGVNLETCRRPIIIGERLNTQGSKRTRELLLADNWDELTALAQEQVAAGAGMLDLCVAVNERGGEDGSMRTLAALLAERVDVPLSLDTTDPAVMAAALRACPGGALLNSINLEKAGARARQVLALARDFGCPVIGLTIDDDGMAATVERKLALARGLAGLACGEFGLPDHFLYIDPLVFTLATGERAAAGAAAASLEAIRRIKAELPGVRTLMGVSNVSYGLAPPARRVLNNLLLHHAAAAGLDAAIFNPLARDDIDKYEPAVRRAGEDLLLDRSPDALAAFVRLFEEKASGGKEPSRKEKRAMARPLSPEETVRAAVISRDRRGLAAALETLLREKNGRRVLDDILLPAMAEVGRRMADGTMILPFVLQAAEVMREALAILEPHLQEGGALRKGTIVLATVFGDVHDIGKNLVCSILRSQGFAVVDLGKQVDTDTIVKAVAEHRPDAVGLSALLVTTSREMAACVRALAGRGCSLPVIIGGAAVNAGFAARIARLEDGSVYKGNVYYCRDAFEAGKIIERAKQGGASPVARPKPVFEKSAPAAAEKRPAPPEYGPVIEPPFYGSSTVLRWEPAQILDALDEQHLFRSRWGGGKLDAPAYSRAEKQEFEPAWQELRRIIAEESLVEPAGIYGYFPIITHGEQAIILDPSDFHTELASFVFPRSAKAGNRSIADWLRPEGDLIAIQAVTIGPKLGSRVRALFSQEDRYSLGFYLNGIGAEVTELLADRVTAEVMRGIGLPKGTGRRYSFGYGGMPPLEEQKKLFEIMAIEERLGISLTQAFQMVPEHSTAGIYLRHPQAEYLA